MSFDIKDKPFGQDNSCKHVHKDWPEGSKCEDCYSSRYIEHIGKCLEDNSPQDVSSNSLCQTADTSSSKVDSTLDTSTLSDKIHKGGFGNDQAIYMEDVREFIKKLKEELHDIQYRDDLGEDQVMREAVLHIVDKLAGDKLC